MKRLIVLVLVFIFASAGLCLAGATGFNSWDRGIGSVTMINPKSLANDQTNPNNKKIRGGRMVEGMVNRQPTFAMRSQTDTGISGGLVTPKLNSFSKNTMVETQNVQTIMPDQGAMRFGKAMTILSNTNGLANPSRGVSSGVALSTGGKLPNLNQMPVITSQATAAGLISIANRSVAPDLRAFFNKAGR